MRDMTYARSFIDHDKRIAATSVHWEQRMGSRQYELDAWDRFVDKVGPDDGGCKPWTASLVDGYGTFSYKGKTVKAHRWIYEQTMGTIPAGMQLDHLCRNRACVNPDHMEVVSQRENILRGEGLAATAARQTHCIHGHEWTPENTYLPMRSDGRPRQRICRACKRARPRPSRAKVAQV